MERVKKGEKYWFIDLYGTTYVVDWLSEFYDEENTTHFLTKNYFHTEEEAESTLKKLRAVLDGADVIDEEKLDKYTEEYYIKHSELPPYANTDTVWKEIKEAYKAGYRKAKEE